MASAAAIHYPQPAGRMASSFATLESLPRSQSMVPPPYFGSVGSPAGPHVNTSVKGGAVIAAQTVASNHAKLHKRSNNPRPRLDTDLARGSAEFPPAYSSPRSGSVRSISKDKIKQNIRKLSLQREESEQTPIDLSKTAQENEERSGLGISTPLDANYACSPSGVRSHGRSVSHTSLQSNTSGSFKPSTPFTIPLRESPRPESPLPRPSVTEDAAQAAEAVSFPRSTSFTKPPMVHSRSSPSPSRLASRSQTDISVASATQTTYSQSSYTRPRRSTNQSVDTMTPRSRSSVDRAFSFLSRSKSREADAAPLDPITRAASIHAARQAFAEREAAEQRKYEEQERKALQRQEKREDRRRRKSDAASTAETKRKHQKTAAVAFFRDRTQSSPSTTAATLRPAVGAARTSFYGFEYADASPDEPLTMPVPVPVPAQTKNSTATMQKQRAVSVPEQSTPSGNSRSLKTKYVRTVTWVRFRLLRLGGS